MFLRQIQFGCCGKRFKFKLKLNLILKNIIIINNILYKFFLILGGLVNNNGKKLLYASIFVSLFLPSLVFSMEKNNVKEIEASDLGNGCAIVPKRILNNSTDYRWFNNSQNLKFQLINENEKICVSNGWSESKFFGTQDMIENYNENYDDVAKINLKNLHAKVVEGEGLHLLHLHKKTSCSPDGDKIAISRFSPQGVLLIKSGVLLVSGLNNMKIKQHFIPCNKLSKVFFDDNKNFLLSSYDRCEDVILNSYQINDYGTCSCKNKNFNVGKLLFNNDLFGGRFFIKKIKGKHKERGSRFLMVQQKKNMDQNIKIFDFNKEQSSMLCDIDIKNCAIAISNDEKQNIVVGEFCNINGEKKLGRHFLLTPDHLLEYVKNKQQEKSSEQK